METTAKLPIGELIKLSEWLQRRDAKLDKLVKEHPMLKFYADVKRRYPSTILFYRIGDFYELFEEDAIIASTLFDDVPITQEWPAMWGVRVNKASQYLSKMIKAGRKVATCETVEDKSSTSGYRHVYTRILKNERKGKQRVFRLPDRSLIPEP